MPKKASSRLLEWYGVHRRDLPWRRDNDPYKVLVSELMLQQTTVETAAPYYERFIAAWPDVASLAAAEERHVLAAWSGLGYYRRARHLLEAARTVMADHGGRVPADPVSLRALPGIGPYTASAVAAIAYGRPEIALDGNLRRVLARLGGVLDDPRSAVGERKLLEVGRTHLEGSDPSSVNQALMDLGATICTPRAPRCLLCPLGEGCKARRRGLTERIPAPPKRPRTIEVRLAAAVIRQGSRVLIHERAGPLMRELCEFPLVDAGEGARSGEPDRVGALFETMLGARLDGLERRGRVRHAITHHRIAVDLYVGAAGRKAGAGARPAGASRGSSKAAKRPPGGPVSRIAEWPRSGSLRWVEATSLAALPLTGISRKILKVLGGASPEGRAAAIRSDSGTSSSARRGSSARSDRRG